ncbi:MAG TPA: molybdenum cofactor biosynthesis protein MoaE [Woeseiaceae bacterium]|nr:molybdenum cofactor biosynthesis protein MoaE [Woeseiaceae bacterium]
MSEVVISPRPIVPGELGAALTEPGAGAFVGFEGRVRNRNEGRAVERLEYEAYAPLAEKEGARIIAEACERWPILAAHCVHRTGMLEIGDYAVWVGVVSPHRDEAFAACRYIIDEVKVRLPIWKKEYYTDGDSGWVNCERCAAGHQHESATAG